MKHRCIFFPLFIILGFSLFGFCKSVTNQKIKLLSSQMTVSNLQDSIQALKNDVASLQDSVKNILAKNPDIDVQMRLNHLEKEVDRYSEYVKTNTSSIENKITWWLGILTAIITIVVGGLGVVAPYLLNRRSGINANKAVKQANDAQDAVKNAQNNLKTFQTQVQEAITKAMTATAQAENARTSLSKNLKKIEGAVQSADVAAKKAKAIQFFIQAMQENDPDRAIDYYTKCIDEDPDFADAYNKRGYLRYRKGEIDSAKQDFENAIAKKENYSEAYNNLGVLLFSQKNFDDANENYDDAEENFNLAGEYAEAIVNLGLLKYAKGDKDNAEKAFDKAIKLKPNFAEAYYIRGLYQLNNRWSSELGVEDIIKAKDYKPNVIEAYPNRNLLTREMKKWDNSFNGVEYSRDFKTLIHVPKDKEGNFKIPESVTEIGNGAFWDCSKLTSVVIPKSVTVIGERAFKGCTNLTSIVITDSVTVIEWGAFLDCTGLTSLEIPDSVKKIGESAFEGCSGIKKYEVSNNNSNYCSIDGALYSKDKVTLIQVPCDRVNFNIQDSVTEIGNNAFWDCFRLTSIEIPNSVTKIGDGAFYNCTSLTSIVIPKSVTVIGDNAFEGCKSLTEIYLKHPSPIVFSRAFKDYIDQKIILDLSKITLYVPKGSVEKYRNHRFYGQFKEVKGE